MQEGEESLVLLTDSRLISKLISHKTVDLG